MNYSIENTIDIYKTLNNTNKRNTGRSSTNLSERQTINSYGRNSTKENFEKTPSQGRNYQFILLIEVKVEESL